MQMERMALQPDQDIDELYVICRVFKLGQKGMSIRMIVDPARHRREGKLSFEASQYTVHTN